MQGKRNQWARIGHEEDGEGGELGRGVGWLAGGAEGGREWFFFSVWFVSSGIMDWFVGKIAWIYIDESSSGRL